MIDLLKPPADLAQPHLVLIVNRTTRLKPLRQLGPGVYHLATDVRGMIRGIGKHAVRWGEVEFHWLAGDTKQVMKTLGRVPPDPMDELAEAKAKAEAEAAAKLAAEKAEQDRLAAEKAANEAAALKAAEKQEEEPIVIAEEPEAPAEPEAFAGGAAPETAPEA
jgi:hypothetical protein